MHTKDTSKKDVFIASSSRVRSHNFLLPVIETLNRQGYNALSWYDKVNPEKITVDDLCRIASEIDFAICFFAEDIKIKLITLFKK